LDAKGKVEQQEIDTDPGDVTSSIAQPYATLCKQSGHEPKFLNNLQPEGNS
jgi:hypothetical protein